MNHLPSTNRDNGRDASGHFLPGNPGGPGNPHSRRVAQLRVRIVETVTDDDLAEIVATLVQCAKAGEPWAVRELFDRLLGKATQPVAVEVGQPRTEAVMELTQAHIARLEALNASTQAELHPSNEAGRTARDLPNL